MTSYVEVRDEYTDAGGNKTLTQPVLKPFVEQGTAGSADKAAYIAQLTGGEPPTEAEFNALLTALKNAGLMATS